eukprot:COSAG02_NODE_26980_length_619_cov_1.955769_1_plen_111_part_01
MVDLQNTPRQGLAAAQRGCGAPDQTPEAKAEFRKEALDWLADLKPDTVVAYTDGGYDPPSDKNPTPRAGWGAAIWHRVIYGASCCTASHREREHSGGTTQTSSMNCGGTSS